MDRPAPNWTIGFWPAGFVTFRNPRYRQTVSESHSSQIWPWTRTPLREILPGLSGWEPRHGGVAGTRGPEIHGSLCEGGEETPEFTSTASPLGKSWANYLSPAFGVTDSSVAMRCRVVSDLVVVVTDASAVGGDFAVAEVDEQDGVLVGDSPEEIHHEFLLAGPGVDKKDINLGGIEAVVSGSSVDGFAA